MHTDVHVGNLRKLLLQILFKLKLGKFVTLNRKLKEILPCQVKSVTPTFIYHGVHDDILQVPLVLLILYLVVNCQMNSSSHGPIFLFSIRMSLII